MRSGIALPLAMVAGVFLAGCSETESVPSRFIQPSLQPQKVSEALDVKIGGQTAARVAGDLPAASTGDRPTITLPATTVGAKAGDVVQVQFAVDSNTAVDALFAKVLGASDTFRVDLNAGNRKASTSFSLSFLVPANFATGNFCLRLAAQAAAAIGLSDTPICFNVTGLDPDTTPPPTVAPAPSSTPAPTQPPSPSPSATTAPTASPSPSPSPSTSPSPSPSPSPTAVASPSPSPSPSVTPTPTATPEPTPTPTPGPDGSTAAACFNATLLEPGTRIVQTYNSSSSDGEVDFTDDRTVGDIVSFFGDQARETNGTTTSTTTSQQGSTTTTTQTSTYTQTDAQVPQVTSLGAETSTSTQAGSTQSTIRIDPGRVTRYDLDAGQSFQQSYTTTVESNVPGFGTVTTTTETDETSTYVGRETVTVPAGTFETCRYDETVTQTTQGQSSTSQSSSWFDTGSGLLVRQVSGDTTSELIEGTINGTPIR